MLTKEQLELRRSGIGGSDAPAVSMCDPYRQPLDVYLEKTGEIPPDDDLETRKEVVRWGNLLEDTVSREWAERRGMKVRRVNQVLKHKDFPFVLGNIDRRVSGLAQGLEVKTRGTFAAEDYGKQGTDQVKQSDIIQCSHYMAVTGWELWNMAVLVGGQELRHYVIPRDETLIDSLLNLESIFWNRVQKRDPPDLDFSHRSAPDLIKKLYPGTNGAAVLLPPEAIAIKEAIATASLERRNAEKQLEELKNRRDFLLADNAIGVLPDGSGGWSRKEIEIGSYKVPPKKFIGTYFSKRHQEYK